MKRITKVFAILIIICLLFAACCKAAGNSNNGVVVTTSLKDKPVVVGGIECEFPLVTKATSLNFLVTGYGT